MSVQYIGEANFQHGEIPAVGILVTNLGTPDAPTSKALRPYLREFLSDPRVIELPRWLWQIILNCFVLTTRPKASAEAYETVWTDEGSPLLVITRQQAEGMEERLRKAVGSPFHVAYAMRYGNPSIASGLRELRDKGCRRILLLPLYPQYAAATTASTFDAVATELMRWRWIPELRTIHHYHDEPGYVRALASSIREVWEQSQAPEKLVFSFHGIPERYFRNGDPYHCECHKTARLVAEHLGLERERYVVSFQSRFGREEWIKPYTDETIRALGKAGVGSVDVVCPGFSADCLETIEEIDVQNREFFEEAGGNGERFRYLPALNARPDHLDMLTDVLLRNLQGWVAPLGQWDAEAAATEAATSKQRADELAATGVRADGGVGT